MSAATLECRALPAGVASTALEGSLGAAALRGELSLPGFRVARALEEVGPPEERLEADERKALSARLERCIAPLRPHVAVLDAIRALRQPGACAVVTGQQPGLCLSPLLSLYKALQAVRLARQLSAAWGRPVVALFWNHADDHDVAEVHHTHLLNENLDVQRVALAGMASGRQPIGRIALDEERHGLGALRGVLEQSLVRRTTDPQRRALAQAAVDRLLPRHGETLATAFTRSMTGLLGHLGLIVLEPEWIREELGRALAGLVDHDPARQLRVGAEAVRAAGFEPAIEPEPAALLYRLDERGRSALRSGGEGFRYDGEPGSRTAAELSAEVVQDLQGWSPGALLRPLAQDMCLPVAAYVGGLGELAYHAQLGPLRQAAGVAITPFVARRSCTLVDPETRASLSRLEVPEDVVLEGRLRESLGAEDAARPAVIDELERAGERAAEELLRPRAALLEFDRALAQNLARTAAQVRSMVGKLVSKGERVHANSSGRGRRHLRRVQSSLRPRGDPQERVLGPLPWIARFGTEWIDELYACLDPFDARHLVARFTPDAASDTTPEEA